jgi:hypothetical protein
VVLLLKRVLVSWLSALDEHGGHEDLRGSGRRSSCYIAQAWPCPCEPEPFSFFDRCLHGPFIAQGRTVTLSRARQVAPRWLKPYISSRVLMAWSS